MLAEAVAGTGLIVVVHDCLGVQPHPPWDGDIGSTGTVPALEGTARAPARAMRWQR